MKVDETNYGILKKVSDITLTDYEIMWFDAENIDGYIENDNLVSMLENLLYEYDKLQEKYDDLESDLESNYRAIPIAEQYGISEREFV